ncbi:retrovirus-related pol polyprotein from transposon TNT 1-94 [Tanacetum coccineum]|uniref:Retrovirus-related pol polyprotein from transposon TNT 1-94 n=1 Tax=Tanacetum coccineum TaxID=301880 RepID=A0ABQ5GHT6_9ASTR
MSCNARDCPKPKVHDVKYFREQMLLAMKDEAGSTLDDEENDFMLDNTYGDETLEELTATVIVMACIQQADDNAKTELKYDAEDVSEVTASHIDLIIEHDSNAHDQFFDIKSLAYNVQREAENQQRLNIELKKQKELLQKEFETCKERVKTLEFRSAQCSKYKETCDELEREIRADKDTIERILKEKDKIERDFFKCENEKLLKELKPELTEEVHEMLNIFESMEKKVKTQPQKDNMFQNEIDRLLEASFTKEIKDCVLISVVEQKNEILMLKKEKILSDSTDIQANLLKRIKILENDIKRPQAQSIDFELKLQHQKEKMACDNSWKSKLTKLSDENVLLKTQVESVVQESENIKLEYQTLFNSIKATQAQHQREINELIENVNQKTFAYSDVRSQNQDLLMTISELKNKLKTIEKGKNVNTKFDKSETLGKLLCVTPLKTNTTVKAKKVSNSEVKVDSGVESSHSVKRPKYKDNKSKNRVLKNTNVKIPSTNDRKVSNNVSVGSNKRETMNSTVCQSSANTPEFLWAKAIATSCFTQNHSLVHTRYNKTPYELIKGRKPNVQYFHVFGSLCYPINDRDDLGKMKPKANIGIFIFYSESSRGFRIYNRRTKKIMETIHVKFDELTAMASECNNSGPGFNCLKFQDSLEDSQSVPSKEDLDNLFGPLYEEYYATRTSEVLNDSDANTLDNEDTPSSSSIVVEEDEAHQIVTSLEEPIANEATTPVSTKNANEQAQEDIAAFDENEFYNPFHSPVLKEAESSSTF